MAQRTLQLGWPPRTQQKQIGRRPPHPPTVRVDRKTCAEGRHAHDQMDSLFVKKKAARAVKKRNTERGTVAFTLKLGKK